MAPSSFVAQFGPSTSQQRPEERGEMKFVASTVSLICFKDNEWSRIPSHHHKSLDMLRIFPDIVAAITQKSFFFGMTLAVEWTTSLLPPPTSPPKKKNPTFLCFDS